MYVDQTGRANKIKTIHGCRQYTPWHMPDTNRKSTGVYGDFTAVTVTLFRGVMFCKLTDNPLATFIIR